MAIDNIVPTTELEAVNAMLACNGKSPVENLDAPLRADVEMALNMILNTSRGIQSRGWHFNSVRAVALSVNGDNQIPVPTHALRVRLTVIDEQRDMDVSHREGFLWNNVTNTDTFLDEPGTWYFDVVYGLDFTALPETARQYIFIAAGRRYQEQAFGNADISNYTKADEAQALQNLVDAEGLIEDVDLNKSAKDQLRVKQVWDAVSAQVQEIGWHFNSRKQVALTPNMANAIVLPMGTLRAYKSNISGQWNINAAYRGSIMYDVKNDSDTWDATQLPDGVLKVDLVMLLDRDDLPPIAKRYIDIKVARQLQDKNKTPNSKGYVSGYTERDEFMAYRDLQDAEGLIEDYSLKNDNNISATLFDRDNLIGTGGFDPDLNR